MFSQDDSWNIFKMLAALLHIGNLEFEGIFLQLLNYLEAYWIEAVWANASPFEGVVLYSWEKRFHPLCFSVHIYCASLYTSVQMMVPMN